MKKPKTRAEWLAEAKLLEEMDMEWETGHAAAVCTLSVSAISISDCPRIYKKGVRGVVGRPMTRYVPWQVKEWNAARTVMLDVTSLTTIGDVRGAA